MTESEFNELKDDTLTTFQEEVDSTVLYIPNGDLVNSVSLKAVVRENSDQKTGQITIPTKSLEEKSIVFDRLNDTFLYGGSEWVIDSITQKPRLFDSSIVTEIAVLRRYWVGKLSNASISVIQGPVGRDTFGKQTYTDLYSNVPCIWRINVRIEGDKQKTEVYDATAVIDGDFTVEAGYLVQYSGNNYIVEAVATDGDGVHLHTRELRLRRVL